MQHAPLDDSALSGVKEYTKMVEQIMCNLISPVEQQAFILQLLANLMRLHKTRMLSTSSLPVLCGNQSVDQALETILMHTSLPHIGSNPQVSCLLTVPYVVEILQVHIWHRKALMVCKGIYYFLSIFVKCDFKQMRFSC